jgi:hypothetical protein
MDSFFVRPSPAPYPVARYGSLLLRGMDLQDVCVQQYSSTDGWNTIRPRQGTELRSIELTAAALAHGWDATYLLYTYIDGTSDMHSVPLFCAARFSMLHM